MSEITPEKKILLKEAKKRVNAKYYQNSKAKILKHLLDKVKCTCGQEMALSNISKHKKTKKHINMMERLLQLDSLINILKKPS